jgi:hypothetical protein
MWQIVVRPQRLGFANVICTASKEVMSWNGAAQPANHTESLK